MALDPVSFSKPRGHQPRLSPDYKPGRNHERFWTDEEREIIKQYYPTGGVAGCLSRLAAHRTPSGVYQLAKKLGVKSSAMMATRGHYDASPELDERIRAGWAELDGKKRGEVAAFADRLGVPRWWLTKRAILLGLTLAHKKEPAWTEAEDALMKTVPLHKPDLCARIFREHGFDRSPTAIVVRAKRLELSRRATREELSARNAADLLGVDSKWVTQRILDGRLVAAKREDQRRIQQGGSAWDIRPADLRKFVIDNLGEIDLRKVEKFGFVALISGAQS